jgi:pimeloyl-ACP methyl ester carboxylesterase
MKRRIDDLRGVVRLAVGGVHGVTRIAQGLHGSIAKVAPPLGKAPPQPAGGIAGFVYGAVRATSSMVGTGLDAALASAQALIPATEAQDYPARDAFVAALNGVMGDELERTRNPLAISMSMVPQDVAGPHLLLLVHGLCMNERQWLRDGHDHGAALAALGYTPVYLRYNSGRHISANGADLASLLQQRIAYAAVPVESLTIIGHSMGGLVARSAVHQAHATGMAWPRLLRAMVFLGTPHHGAPLERGGNRVHRALGISPYLAPFTRLSALRSDGITDLRHGNVIEADWAADKYSQRDARVPVPLPRGVACYAIAGAVADPRAEALLGDGLVSVDSALGRHERTTRDLHFPPSHTWTASGVHHLDLLGSKAVYGKLRQWLAPSSSAQPR